MIPGQSVPLYYDMNFYRQIYDIWSRTTAEMLDEAMRTPAFAAMMGKAFEQSLDFKQQMEAAFDTSLKSLQFAAASDIKAILEELRTVHTKLVRTSSTLETAMARIHAMEEQLQKLTPRSPAAS